MINLVYWRYELPIIYEFAGFRVDRGFSNIAKNRFNAAVCIIEVQVFSYL